MFPIQRSQFYAQVRTYLRINRQLVRGMAIEAEAEEEAESRHRQYYEWYQQQQNQEQLNQQQASLPNGFRQWPGKPLHQNGGSSPEEASSFDCQLPQVDLSSEIDPQMDATFHADCFYLIGELISTNPAEVENSQQQMEELLEFDANADFGEFINEVTVETSSLEDFFGERGGNFLNQLSETESNPSLIVVTDDEDEGKKICQLP